MFSVKAELKAWVRAYEMTAPIAKNPVAAVGAALVSGGSVVLSERFSASRFWDEIVESKCTTFQYFGELCRYLVNTAPHPQETRHQLRLACGKWTAGRSVGEISAPLSYSGDSRVLRGD